MSSVSNPAAPGDLSSGEPLSVDLSSNTSTTVPTGELWLFQFTIKSGGNIAVAGGVIDSNDGHSAGLLQTDGWILAPEGTTVEESGNGSISIRGVIL